MLPKLLLFYDHFYPAYKAGGPVQSVANMVRELSTHFDCYVVCKPHELNEQDQLKGIEANTWINWNDKARVYYWNYTWGERKKIKQIIHEVSPQFIFINGLYSLYFNLLPVYYAIKHTGSKVIWSARGMLHSGALQQKAFKKKIFLFLLKQTTFSHKVIWHATDQQEVTYIQHIFGHSVDVKVASNFPNLLPELPVKEKFTGELVLGTISLISPMKNHKAVLKALASCQSSIRWLIYGPVKDAAYWKECEMLICQLPSNIRVEYCGEVLPTHIADALNTIHVFIMPSQSENFGHALAEALSAGKPIITTTTTPFANIEAANAGRALNLEGLEQAITLAINDFAAMNHETYSTYCRNAASYIRQKLQPSIIKEQYLQLLQ